ncbi:MAG: ATP-binding cassette domain-containing protein, partial [Acetobacteraceae bacterium]
MAGGQSAAAAGNRQPRPRHRGVHLPWRPGLAADRAGRLGRRGRHRRAGRRSRRLLRRLGGRPADADHRGLPDGAEFHPAAGAGGGLRLGAGGDHHCHRPGRLDRALPAGAGGIPVAAVAGIRPGRAGPRHARCLAHPGRGVAECAAAGDRLCQRDHGHRHSVGERAGLPRPVGPERRLLGQHDRCRAGGAADRVVCLGDSRRGDPDHGAGLQPGGPGAERCAEPADAGALSAPLLSLRNVSVRLPKGADREFALQGINLDVAAGEILCVVGESGSGKSLTATAILGLLPAPRVTLAGGSRPRIAVAVSDLPEPLSPTTQRIS